MSANAIQALRQFNRFYTRTIGVLQEGLLGSPFSLTEVRVLYELAHQQDVTATTLIETLRLDAGYMSRLLSALERRRLIRRQRSAADGRQSIIRLTPDGAKTFAALDRRQDEEVSALLGAVSPADQARLCQAVRTVERVLGGPDASAEPEAFRIRSHRPGDMGWVVHRHGVLYAEEYGWDERFEALVAKIVAEFIEHFDPARERCWIAERDGPDGPEMVGSIFLVRQSETVGKLRLLLVEPSARGLGVATRLVDDLLAFAREVGYQRITLWTQSNLDAARRVYQRAGFQLAGEEPHHSFGHALVAQTWERATTAR